MTRSILPWLGLFSALLITHLGLYAYSASAFTLSGALIAAALAATGAFIARTTAVLMFERPLETMVAGLEQARMSGDLTYRLDARGGGALPRLAESYNRLVTEFSAAMAKMLFTSQRPEGDDRGDAADALLLKNELSRDTVTSTMQRVRGLTETDHARYA